MCEHLQKRRLYDINIRKEPTKASMGHSWQSCAKAFLDTEGRVNTLPKLLKNDGLLVTNPRSKW